MAITTASTRVSLRLILQKTAMRNRNFFSFASAAGTGSLVGGFMPMSCITTNTNRYHNSSKASLQQQKQQQQQQKKQQQQQEKQQQQRRNLSGFRFLGPRELQDIFKTELLDGKKGTEIADLWFTYHETKDDVLGLVLDGKDGKTILSRATTCPYFVQPVFRDDGFFMLLSEFQPPHHFLLAYLQDYKMDPNSATPLLTFSLFNTYADDPQKNITLVRCDVLNKNLNLEEGRKVVQSLLDNYRHEVDYAIVKLFNQRPNAFDIDDHIARMNVRWSQDGSSSSSSDNGSDSSSSTSSTTITTP